MADRTRTVAVAVDEKEPGKWLSFVWPWQLICVVGALVVVLAGWVLVGGVTAVAWLAAPDVPLRAALTLATQVFGSAHGASLEIGPVGITLMPLGLTFIMVFLSLPVAHHVARQADDQRTRPEVIVWRVAGTYALAYCATTTVGVGTVAGSQLMGPVFVGSLSVGAISGLWGASGALDYDPTSAWPGWLRIVPRALTVAVLSVVVIATVALTIALVTGRGRIATLAESLQPDATGQFALVALHLIYLPNLVLWLVSWVLGAGFTLGDGSNLTPLFTDVGLQPAIPVLGAVPEPGPLGGGWWLLSGVLAGLLAGVAVARARPRARFDESTLSGALAGIGAGLAITLLASAASGSLGGQRLMHVGANLSVLVVLAPSVLGLSGALGGLILGLIRFSRRRKRAEQLTEERAESPKE
ncbi:DUF6350 family protein [Tessaracoccus sp. OH4464_COT-324]|uniref:cell division protein PerM n=1 Tax=Tessaracoccus sp. OH4464_COT-324 TaxID=2491059 RepID=UPI000F63C36E|nr:DUF6350 family protein [Tessaracoccus sp. OH4464_COT-324]RRD46652.1 hypothetical protein EII42_06465 [Tessaracoccus sp. OH4464_COT-324]